MIKNKSKKIMDLYQSTYPQPGMDASASNIYTVDKYSIAGPELLKVMKRWVTFIAKYCSDTENVLVPYGYEAKTLLSTFRFDNIEGKTWADIAISERKKIIKFFLGGTRLWDVKKSKWIVDELNLARAQILEAWQIGINRFINKINRKINKQGMVVTPGDLFSINFLNASFSEKSDMILPGGPNWEGFCSAISSNNISNFLVKTYSLNPKAKMLSLEEYVFVIETEATISWLRVNKVLVLAADRNLSSSVSTIETLARNDYLISDDRARRYAGMITASEKRMQQIYIFTNPLFGGVLKYNQNSLASISSKTKEKTKKKVRPTFIFPKPSNKNKSDFLLSSNEENLLLWKKNLR